MYQAITPINTKYPFDVLDSYLYGKVHIPYYWIAREIAKAYSEEHLQPNVAKESRRILVTAGFAGHRALTGIGGAYYHLELLENALHGRSLSLAIQAIHFVIWEELEPLFNSLYSAWNGMINYAYIILCPDSIDPNSMKYEGQTWSTGIKNRPAPQHFFANDNSMKPIFDALDNCKNCFGIRHKAVHRYRSYLYLTQRADKSWMVSVPKDMKITQTTIIPPQNINTVDAIELARESITTCEQGFDQVYKYIRHYWK